MSEAVQLTHEYIVHPNLGLRFSKHGWKERPELPTFKKIERDANAMVERWWHRGFPVRHQETLWATLHIVLTNVPCTDWKKVNDFQFHILDAFHRITGIYADALQNKLFSFLDNSHWLTLHQLQALKDQKKRRKEKTLAPFMLGFEDPPETSTVDINMDMSFDL